MQDHEDMKTKSSGPGFQAAGSGGVGALAWWWRRVEPRGRRWSGSRRLFSSPVVKATRRLLM